jgi:large subunit ribosomal protein L7A
MLYFALFALSVFGGIQMLDCFKGHVKVIGLKQTKKAIRDKTAQAVYIAKDADKPITEPVCTMCSQNGIEIVMVDSMRELGHACGIEVGCAVAAIIK